MTRTAGLIYDGRVETREARDEQALSEKKLIALDLAMSGKTDGEIAEAVGVSRQWVNKWRNHDREFMRALQERRDLLREQQMGRISELLGKAISILEEALQSEDEGETREKNGTLVRFLPDQEVFSNFAFDDTYINQRLWRYAYLNAGLSIYLNGTRYFSEKGLLDLLAGEINGNHLYPPIFSPEKALEFAFTHTDDYGDSYFSFVNGTYTSEGGTHL